MTTLAKADLADLKRAKALLENPGLAAKLSSMLGAPVEKGVKLLPVSWQKGVHKATEAALMKAGHADHGEGHALLGCKRVVIRSGGEALRHP